MKLYIREEQQEDFYLDDADNYKVSLTTATEAWNLILTVHKGGHVMYKTTVDNEVSHADIQLIGDEE
jgi:hypothetical protein